MKLRFLTIALAFFALGSLIAIQPPARADTSLGENWIELERYPTETEIADLLVEMRLKIPRMLETGYYTDRRSPETRQQLETFVAAWEEVDRDVAPFLGDWTALEESLAIFPTPNRGEVCVIDTYLDDSAFYLGQVKDGRVYTATNLVFTLDSGFLASMFVHDDEPGVYEYGVPRPLQDPLKQEWLVEGHPDVVAEFQKAGCLVQTPSNASKS